MPDDKRIAVLGAGMHPWGKWGRPFVEYGLAAEKLVVMGQVVAGVTVDDLQVGDEMELVIDTLYAEDDQEFLVWKWQPVAAIEGA